MWQLADWLVFGVFGGLTLTLGFFFGFFIASRFDIHTKVSKKEDYEAKIKVLDDMIEEWNNKEHTEESPKFRTSDFFPEDLNRDFGLPRELK